MLCDVKHLMNKYVGAPEEQQENSRTSHNQTALRSLKTPHTNRMPNYRYSQ